MLEVIALVAVGAQPGDPDPAFAVGYCLQLLLVGPFERLILPGLVCGHGADGHAVLRPLDRAGAANLLGVHVVVAGAVVRPDGDPVVRRGADDARGHDGQGRRIIAERNAVGIPQEVPVGVQALGVEAATVVFVVVDHHGTARSVRGNPRPGFLYIVQVV